MDKFNEILQKYSDAKRDQLIPLLQEIQDEEGFISKEAIILVGKHLKMPTSKIYGVATFYNQFRFEPQGKYHIQVCRGTACHVLGSATVLEELEKNLKSKAIYAIYLGNSYAYLGNVQESLFFYKQAAVWDPDQNYSMLNSKMIEDNKFHD